jgi:surfactin synthase thioesterase subunit
MCFPYAGGGASAFRLWSRALPAEIELCAVQLPGREERIAETPLTDWHEAAERLVTALKPWMDRPFALFGHSLGALLAFEVAHWVLRDRQPGLVGLFVSAHEAPHLPSDDPPACTLPEEDFVQRLRGYDGTPDGVFDEPALRDVFLPLLRADFRLSETYAYEHDAPLTVPISAYGGVQDEHVSAATLDAWREHTTRTFRRLMFSGGHFFLHQHREALVGDVARQLALPPGWP